jgi:hypothetical protein
MNRRDWLKAAFSFGAIAIVIGASATAVAARDADLPAEGYRNQRRSRPWRRPGWSSGPGARLGRRK